MSLKTPVKNLTIRAKIEEKDFEEIEKDLKSSTCAETVIFEGTRGVHTDVPTEIEVEF